MTVGKLILLTVVILSYHPKVQHIARFGAMSGTSELTMSQVHAHAHADCDNLRRAQRNVDKDDSKNSIYCFLNDSYVHYMLCVMRNAEEGRQKPKTEKEKNKARAMAKRKGRQERGRFYTERNIKKRAREK